MINSYHQPVSPIKETSDNTIKIAIATTPAEKQEIFRFRYKTYVEEMSKQIEGIDHANKLLKDELDEWGLLLYAKIGEQLIATSRINIGNLKKYPKKLVGILSLDKFQDCYTESTEQSFAYVTKLMVAPAHRSSPVLYLLIAKCYELCCENQVQFAFGACNFHLLRLYEQMGFHRYCYNFVDPGYGLLAPIVMSIDDIQHFRTVRSPLLRAARKRREVSTQSVQWFNTNIRKHSKVINSQIVSDEELWSVLCENLDRPPTEAVSVLQDLTVIEAKLFLHCCSTLIHCNSGDIITMQGDVSYSYNLLISGKLTSLTFISPIKHYASPGQHFGANGLTEHNRHTEDIMAISSSEIMVLSGIAFQRFRHSYPDIAHKIVRNLRRLTKNMPLKTNKLL